MAPKSKTYSADFIKWVKCASCKMHAELADVSDSAICYRCKAWVCKYCLPERHNEDCKGVQ